MKVVNVMARVRRLRLQWKGAVEWNSSGFLQLLSTAENLMRKGLMGKSSLESCLCQDLRRSWSRTLDPYVELGDEGGLPTGRSHWHVPERLAHFAVVVEENEADSESADGQRDDDQQNDQRWALVSSCRSLLKSENTGKNNLKIKKIKKENDTEPKLMSQHERQLL